MYGNPGAVPIFQPQQGSKSQMLRICLMLLFPVSSSRQPTAIEINKRIINEVKAQKAKENAMKKPELELDLPKCDLHPQKLSINCRTCKKIKAMIDEKQQVCYYYLLIASLIVKFCFTGGCKKRCCSSSVTRGRRV